MKSDDNVKSLFLSLIDLASESERNAFLDEHCGSNSALRQELLALLQHDREGGSFLAKQAFATQVHNPAEHASAEHASAGRPTQNEHSGTIIAGKYTLAESIGEGGMGSVWRAKQSEPVKRFVAVKLIKAGMDSKQVLARFDAERQALALMDHPNIAKVLDGGLHDGRPYFVMELVKGVPITEYCDYKKLTPQQRLELFVSVCHAIQHAHQKGIIHRDIKPSNVLVAMYDDQPVVKVIDFGVAKATGGNLTEATIDTGFSSVVGTPQYMSPEQATFNNLDIDTRSDVYALGILLYELLAGSTPFSAKELQQKGLLEILRVVREEEPPRPSTRVSTANALPYLSAQRGTEPKKLAGLLRNELDWIVMKALEKDRTRRYETANGFAADVLRYLAGEPVQAHPPSTAYRLNKFVRRNRVPVMAGAAVSLALVAGVIGTSWQAFQAERARAGERDQRIVAVEQRQLAKDQEQLALQREAAAVESRQLALKNQYNAEIVSGQVDLQRGYLRRLESKLRGHLPLGDQKDRRGWEWNYLWAAGHPEVRTLSASSPSQTFATWSPDGRYIGSSGDIWDAATGQSLWRFEPSYYGRTRSAWSPDSQYFAWGTSSDDNCVYLWNRETDELHELRGHTQSVWCLAWSPDGKQLISGGIDKTLRIWDIVSREVVRSLQAPDYITDVAFSPDGELIAACVKQRGVLVWQAVSSELLTELHASSEEVNHIQLSWRPDGRQLAVSTTNAWLLFGRDDWSLNRTQKVPSQRGRDISWSPDGSRLAVADGQVITLWDPSAAEPDRVLAGHTAPVINVDWSPSGQKMVSSDDLGAVKIWDLKTHNNPAFSAVDEQLQSLAWSDDGNRLLVEHTDGGTSIWNLQDASQVTRSPSSEFEGKSFWSSDRKRVARSSDIDPGVVRIYRGKEKALHAICRLGSEGRVCQMAWSNDGTTLAIAQHLEKRITVTIWDVDSEKRISKWIYVAPFSLKPHSADFLILVLSPDYKHLAVGALGEEGGNGSGLWDGHIYLISVQSGACVLKHNVGGVSHSTYLRAIAWRPDGQAIVAGTQMGLIEAISVDSETIIFSHPLNSTSIRSLSWNLDGDRIAAAADDGSVKILDASSGTDLLTFSLEGKPHHVSWSPNGRRLAAATPTGQIQVWDATPAYAWEENKDRRGELVRSYAMSAVGETATERELRLRKVLDLAPDILDTWMLRGSAYGKLGDFEGAAAEYSKVISRNRKRSQSAAYLYGIALLGSWKFDAFREHCSAMRNDLKGSAQNPSLKRNFIRLTMLTPQVDIDPEISIQIGRDFVEIDGASNASAKLVLGTCLYRGSKFQEAADVLAEAAAQLERQGNPAERPDLANALCVLAMTRHQLGHHFQANRMLEQSLEIAQKLPSDLSWSIRVPLQVLQREARGLIQDGPIGGEKQKTNSGK